MPSSRYARRRQGSKMSLFVHHNYRKLKRCCNQPQLQHKANETFLKALCAATEPQITVYLDNQLINK